MLSLFRPKQMILKRLVFYALIKHVWIRAAVSALECIALTLVAIRKSHNHFSQTTEEHQMIHTFFFLSDLELVFWVTAWTGPGSVAGAWQTETLFSPENAQSSLHFSSSVLAAHESKECAAGALRSFERAESELFPSASYSHPSLCPIHVSTRPPQANTNIQNNLWNTYSSAGDMDTVKTVLLIIINNKTSDMISVMSNNINITVLATQVYILNNQRSIVLLVFL